MESQPLNLKEKVKIKLKKKVVAVFLMIEINNGDNWRKISMKRIQIVQIFF